MCTVVIPDVVETIGFRKGLERKIETARLFGSVRSMHMPNAKVSTIRQILGGFPSRTFSSDREKLQRIAETIAQDRSRLPSG